MMRHTASGAARCDSLFAKLDTTSIAQCDAHVGNSIPHLYPISKGYALCASPIVQASGSGLNPWLDSVAQAFRPEAFPRPLHDPDPRPVALSW
jgi:hypothetical protein